jgi:DNA-binding SARP family transcriptional activator
MIVCRTLGPLELTLDGTPAAGELLWQKNLALLVYLARSPRRTRARSHLMALLWGDKPQARARHSLNEAMRVLRRSLGEPYVDTDAQQIRLAPEGVRLDVEQLEQFLAGREWCRAARLVAGEFMEGFAVSDASGFEDWLTSERTIWRRRSVEALVHCAEELLAAGAVREAVASAERAIALDPRSDFAARASIRSLALAGERAAALETYETFARSLADELDARPEPETTALAERVRRGRPAPPARRDGHEAIDARLPLAGRGRELARLLEAAARCLSRAGAAAIVIDGDAGTGKTRLVEELLARLRLDGAVVAAVRMVEADSSEPWSGIRTLASGGLLSASGLPAAEPGALAAFASELTDWAERFPGVADVTPLPIRWSIGELLRCAAEEQPMFLAVDDAEWMDRESLLSLEAVLRDLQRLPVGLILTVGRTPSPEIDQLRTRIGRDLTGATVSLGPLGVAELRELARRILPRFDEVEVDRVARRVAVDSAGIPLLAVELLRAVALGMDLAEVSGAWPEPLKTLDQTLPGDLPGAVVSAIRVGFGRLSRGARTVLAAASVLQDRVPVDVLARAVDVSRSELIEALDELEWHRWLVSEPRGYEFTARIVRQVVARDMLTPGQRRRVLERLGH